MIGRLEDDDYTGMEQGVYLRGYLSSYARLVGVPTVGVETIASQHTHAAPLVATGQMSRSRYLFDRYSVSATYLILTGLIVVPAVWLATHGGLEQNLARTTPLDSPTDDPGPGADTHRLGRDGYQRERHRAHDQHRHGNVARGHREQRRRDRSAPRQEQPVVASMTPFASQSARRADATPASHVGSGAHSMKLKLSEASWVEILAADGSKLEYGILPAGVERSYSSDKRAVGAARQRRRRRARRSTARRSILRRSATRTSRACAFSAKTAPPRPPPSSDALLNPGRPARHRQPPVPGFLLPLRGFAATRDERRAGFRAAVRGPIRAPAMALPSPLVFLRRFHGFRRS